MVIYPGSEESWLAKEAALDNTQVLVTSHQTEIKPLILLTYCGYTCKQYISLFITQI